MPAVQKSIYYLTSESLAAINNSPFLEDLINEYAIPQLKEFNEKLIAVSKEGFELEEEKEKAETLEFNDICMTVKEVLGDKVEKVIVSNHITSLLPPPACSSLPPPLCAHHWPPLHPHH